MKPQPKVFTKENPCTKLDIWNCFRTASGFAGVSVVLAQSIIGKNVPRVMEREGRVVVRERHGEEYYALTEEGKEWLYEGFRRYLKNHPADVAKATCIPPEWGYTASTARLRRTR